MKLATLRLGAEAATVAVRIDADAAVEIDGYADVGALLATDGWREVAAAANGTQHPLDDIEPTRWAPVVPRPGKVFCVGLNYRTHIEEMGHQFPEYPTIFSKFSEALIGPFDDVELSPLSEKVDWEAELAVVIGRRARHIDEADAGDYIAGYAIFNDVSMRDFQNRTGQWLQGKTFENTSPFGPFLVTTDEWQRGGRMMCVVDGELVQDAPTSDLLFTPEHLVSYLSKILTLEPGDVIATGTTGGVGHARTPARYLQDGAVLETVIEGLGAQRNVARRV